MSAAGWVPGGDCEHQRDGLDRSPILGRLFCPKCGREEQLRALARQNSDEAEVRPHFGTS